MDHRVGGAAHGNGGVGVGAAAYGPYGPCPDPPTNRAVQITYISHYLYLTESSGIVFYLRPSGPFPRAASRRRQAHALSARRPCSYPSRSWSQWAIPYKLIGYCIVSNNPLQFTHRATPARQPGVKRHGPNRSRRRCNFHRWRRRMLCRYRVRHLSRHPLIIRSKQHATDRLCR